MADGQVLAEWVAISPLSHRIGGCEWRQPLKQMPPLPALPANTSSFLPSQETQTAPQDTIITPPSKSEEKEEWIEPPPMPIFLPDQEPVKPKHHDNTARIPATRIVVDDPGVIEDDNKP